MIEKKTIELVDRDTLQADIGDKSQLQTDDKSNIVSAINEVKGQVDGLELTSTKVIRPNTKTVEGSLVANEASISNLESGLEETNTDLKNIGDNFNKLKDKVDKGQNHKLCEDNGTAVLLNSGFDLNTLRNTGIYNGNQFLNAPNNSGDWWYIEVIQHTNLNGYVYQKATSLADFNNIQVFHRQMVGNTWGEWRSL